MQQQIETNTINLSNETKMDTDAIIAFMTTIAAGQCPVCNDGWYYMNAHSVQGHVLRQHPDEYHEYLEAKRDIKLKSLSAIEERLVAILKEGPQTRDQLVKKLFPDTPVFVYERTTAVTYTGNRTKKASIYTISCRSKRTTVYDGLRKLIIRNMVKKFPLFATERNRGRPQVLFSLLDGK